jgi:hypothetical protein
MNFNSAAYALLVGVVVILYYSFREKRFQTRCCC